MGKECRKSIKVHKRMGGFKQIPCQKEQNVQTMRRSKHILCTYLQSSELCVTIMKLKGVEIALNDAAPAAGPQNLRGPAGEDRQRDQDEIKKVYRRMDFLSSNAALMLQRSMDYLWTKQSCILDNIADAETPGYKTKYATFEESLQQAIQSADNKNGTTSGMRAAIESATLSVQQAQESTRLDDNGVNVTEQMVELSRNGYQMQYVLDAINSDFALLRSAIKG